MEEIKERLELVCKDNLTSEETSELLSHYFEKDIAENIVIAAKNLTTWSNGHIVVIKTNDNPKFAIIAKKDDFIK